MHNGRIHTVQISMDVNFNNFSFGKLFRRNMASMPEDTVMARAIYRWNESMFTTQKPVEINMCRVQFLWIWVIEFLNKWKEKKRQILMKWKIEIFSQTKEPGTMDSVRMSPYGQLFRPGLNKFKVNKVCFSNLFSFSLIDNYIFGQSGAGMFDIFLKKNISSFRSNIFLC